jgi:hypothetical protein
MSSYEVNRGYVYCTPDKMFGTNGIELPPVPVNSRTLDYLQMEVTMQPISIDAGHLFDDEIRVLFQKSA